MENKKNILMSIYNIDTAESKFHNKLKFMNLTYLLGSLNKFSDAHLEKIYGELSKVESIIVQVNELVDSLEKPALDLVASYNVDELAS